MTFKRKLLIQTYSFLKRINYFNKKSYQATIITFHSVNPFVSEKSSVLHIHPEDFNELMEIIHDDYHPLSLSDLIEHLKSKKPIPENSVVITFDDGYLDNFEYAAPILKKYGLPACFFLTSGYINTNRVYPWHEDLDIKLENMNWDHARALKKDGFEIGAHTINHPNLAKVSDDLAETEIRGSKEKIESEINSPVTLFAYPFGGAGFITESKRQIVKDLGYNCCCSAYGGKIDFNADLYDLRRVSNYPTTIETLMELDGFMTYYQGKMKINLP